MTSVFGFSDRVVQAMTRADRRRFLPAEFADSAGVDAPLPIGLDQTNSQPTTVAIMMDLLDVQEGNSVLDVGAGSGWTTAILSNLVGPSGRVIGVERHASLTDSAREALQNYLKDTGGPGGATPNATIHTATPGVLGWPSQAPYQRILVSAMADRVPQQLFDQLAEGGVMVIPVSGVMLKVVRQGGRASISRHGLFRFVPLVED